MTSPYQPKYSNYVYTPSEINYDYNLDKNNKYYGNDANRANKNYESPYTTTKLGNVNYTPNKSPTPSTTMAAYQKPSPSTSVNTTIEQEGSSNTDWIFKQEKKKLDILEKEKEKLNTDVLAGDNVEPKKIRITILEKLIEEQKSHLQVKYGRNQESNENNQAKYNSSPQLSTQQGASSNNEKSPSKPNEPSSQTKPSSEEKNSQPQQPKIAVTPFEYNYQGPILATQKVGVHPTYTRYASTPSKEYSSNQQQTTPAIYADANNTTVLSSQDQEKKPEIQTNTTNLSPTRDTTSIGQQQVDPIKVEYQKTPSQKYEAYNSGQAINTQKDLKSSPQRDLQQQPEKQSNNDSIDGKDIKNEQNQTKPNATFVAPALIAQLNLKTNKAGSANTSTSPQKDNITHENSGLRKAFEAGQHARSFEAGYHTKSFDEKDVSKLNMPNKYNNDYTQGRLATEGDSKSGNEIFAPNTTFKTIENKQIIEQKETPVKPTSQINTTTPSPKPYDTKLQKKSSIEEKITPLKKMNSGKSNDLIYKVIPNDDKTPPINSSNKSPIQTKDLKASPVSSSSQLKPTLKTQGSATFKAKTSNKSKEVTPKHHRINSQSDEQSKTFYLDLVETIKTNPNTTNNTNTNITTTNEQPIKTLIGKNSFEDFTSDQAFSGNFGKIPDNTNVKNDKKPNYTYTANNYPRSTSPYAYNPAKRTKSPFAVTEAYNDSFNPKAKQTDQKTNTGQVTNFNPAKQTTTANDKYSNFRKTDTKNTPVEMENSNASKNSNDVSDSSPPNNKKYIDEKSQENSEEDKQKNSDSDCPSEALSDQYLASYSNIPLTKSEYVFKERTPGRLPSRIMDSPLNVKKGTSPKKVAFDLKKTKEIIYDRDYDEECDNFTKKIDIFNQLEDTTNKKTTNNTKTNTTNTILTREKSYPKTGTATTTTTTTTTTVGNDQTYVPKSTPYTKEKELEEKLNRCEKLLRETILKCKDKGRELEQFEDSMIEMKMKFQKEIKELKEQNQKLTDEITKMNRQHKLEIDNLNKKNNELMKQKQTPNNSQEIIAKPKASPNVGQNRTVSPNQNSKNIINITLKPN